MSIFRAILAAALAVATSLAIVSEATAQTRGYVGELTDGTKLQGKELLGNPESPADQKLDDTPLFAPNNPVRWLRNRVFPANPTPPQTFLELDNGDLLTGEVSHYVPADAADNPFGVPHLVVASLTSVDWPGKP